MMSALDTAADGSTIVRLDTHCCGAQIADSLASLTTADGSLCPTAWVYTVRMMPMLLPEMNPATAEQYTPLNTPNRKETIEELGKIYEHRKQRIKHGQPRLIDALMLYFIDKEVLTWDVLCGVEAKWKQIMGNKEAVAITMGNV